MMKLKFAGFTKYSRYYGILKSFIFSSLTGTILVIIRVMYTNEFTFLFLIWNLFLAMVPFFFSYIMESRPVIYRSKAKFFTMLMLWLLFLPNAPYIITDFFHLYNRPGIPLWYDLIILIIFAWNGIMAGFISLLIMQKIISARYSIRTGWIFVFAVLLLTGFGVYIGRYLRYNSWDILIIPFPLFRDIFTILLNPVKYKDAYGMTAGMTIFLSVAYLMFFNLTKLKYSRSDT